MSLAKEILDLIEKAVIDVRLVQIRNGLQKVFNILDQAIRRGVDVTFIEWARKELSQTIELLSLRGAFLSRIELTDMAMLVQDMRSSFAQSPYALLRDIPEAGDIGHILDDIVRYLAPIMREKPPEGQYQLPPVKRAGRKELSQ